MQLSDQTIARLGDAQGVLVLQHALQRLVPPPGGATLRATLRHVVARHDVDAFMPLMWRRCAPR